jgi:hypothetical protein
MSESDAQLEQQLAEFFRNVLIPLADTARQKAVEFFPLGPESSGSSYYSELGEKRTYLHAIDLSKMENELRTMWEESDLPELASIAGKLAEFSELLKERESERDEISPFIYAMF